MSYGQMDPEGSYPTGAEPERDYQTDFMPENDAAYAAMGMGRLTGESEPYDED